VEDCRGVVYLEFILAFVPVFTLCLGIVQLALLSVAQLVVQHAAVAATRSAVVVLEDDPKRHGGTPRRDVSDRGLDSSSAYTRLGRMLGLPKHAALSVFPLGGPRMAAIRQAAHLPLAAISPDPKLVALSAMPGSLRSVERALGSSGATRLSFGLFVYTPLATAVTFPRAPGSRELMHDRLDALDHVTVRVTHIVPCAVPIAAQLLCKKLGEMLGLDAERKAGLLELRHAPGHDAQRWLHPMRVAILRAEATLPAQPAPYPYASELPPGERS
jgi:hypothetical protein